MVDALKILFDVVTADWAATYPWPDIKTQARSLEAQPPTIARMPLADQSADQASSI